MAWLFGVAVAAVIVSALRSTWSPCSLSMLSSMTPLSERSRGHRWGVTAGWYIVGSLAGGATIGALLTLPALLVGAVDPGTPVRLAVVAAVGLLAAAADLHVTRLPRHGRQVDENWFDRYRPWVYASGFGWQVGNGVVTFTTTAALYLAATAAVMTGEPSFVLGAGVGFGAVRGLMVLPGVQLRSFAAVARMHQRLDRWAEPSRVVTASSVGLLAFVAAAAAGPVVAVVTALAGAAVVVRAVRIRPTIDGRAATPSMRPIEA